MNIVFFLLLSMDFEMKFELVVLVSYLRRSPEDYELCMPTPESAEVYQEKNYITQACQDIRVQAYVELRTGTSMARYQSADLHGNGVVERHDQFQYQSFN